MSLSSYMPAYHEFESYADAAMIMFLNTLFKYYAYRCRSSLSSAVAGTNGTPSSPGPPQYAVVGKGQRMVPLKWCEAANHPTVAKYWVGYDSETAEDHLPKQERNWGTRMRTYYVCIYISQSR